ncbi:hypothetical protein [Melittangium boletus]|uniref:hypothetical protein n=1 Tax=Melittangium boletus TaxID=83453 RepID=UPI003DA5F74D
MHPTSHLPPPRHVLAVGAALVHLLLVLCSVLHLPHPGRPLRFYAQWSGADRQYKFFAPDITPSVRVTFETTLESGERVREEMRTTDDVMDVRMYCLSLNFHLLGGQDDVARAWAAKVFGRHATARSVSLRMEEFRLPPLARYHEGQRPHWAERYQASFERRPASVAQAVRP